MAREGSPADKREDTRGAKKLGMSLGAFEKSPKDKAQDRGGKKRKPAPAPFGMSTPPGGGNEDMGGF